MFWFCCTSKEEGDEKPFEGSPDECAARENAAKKIQARNRGNQGRKEAKERQAQLDAYKAAAGKDGCESENLAEGADRTGASRLMQIEIKTAKALRDLGGRFSQASKRTSPFVRCCIGDVEFETTIIKNKCNPAWNEAFEIVDFVSGTDIKLEVFHPSVKKNPEICLGRAVLSASKFEKEGFEGDLKLADTGVKKGDSFISVCISWASPQATGKRISAFKDAPIEMWIARFRKLGLRSGPGTHEQRVGVDLHPGEEFGVIEIVAGAGGQEFLRLADGRGWAFTKSAKDGECLAERLQAKEAVVLEDMEETELRSEEANNQEGEASRVDNSS